MTLIIKQYTLKGLCYTVYSDGSYDTEPETLKVAIRDKQATPKDIKKASTMSLLRESVTLLDEAAIILGDES